MFQKLLLSHWNYKIVHVLLCVFDSLLFLAEDSYSSWNL